MKLFTRKPATAAIMKPAGLAWTHSKSRALVGPLFEYFEAKYRPKRLSECKMRAVKAHHCALRAFARYLGRPAIVSDLTEKYLRGFITLGIQCRARGSVQRDLDCLIALSRFAFERDDLQVMPKLQRGDVPKVQPIEERGPL